MVTNLCAEKPAGVLCLTRSILGKLMYHQVFGLTSLVLAVLAIWRNTVWLCILAMIASIGGFALYNAGPCAIAFVMAGLTLAHTKLAQDFPDSQHNRL
jgi:hypothetical protein